MILVLNLLWNEMSTCRGRMHRLAQIYSKGQDDRSNRREV